MEALWHRCYAYEGRCDNLLIRWADRWLVSVGPAVVRAVLQRGRLGRRWRKQKNNGRGGMKSAGISKGLLDEGDQESG